MQKNLWALLVLLTLTPFVVGCGGGNPVGPGSLGASVEPTATPSSVATPFAVRPFAIRSLGGGDLVDFTPPNSGTMRLLITWKNGRILGAALTSQPGCWFVPGDARNSPHWDGPAEWQDLVDKPSICPTLIGAPEVGTGKSMEFNRPVSGTVTLWIANYRENGSSEEGTVEATMLP